MAAGPYFHCAKQESKNTGTCVKFINSVHTRAMFVMQTRPTELGLYIFYCCTEVSERKARELAEHFSLHFFLAIWHVMGIWFTAIGISTMAFNLNNQL